MTYVAVASASGSPGVTTSVLGLALAAPRPVLLVEADVAGGSTILATWFQGRPPHNRGIVNLAMAHRSGSLTEALGDVVIGIPDTEISLVAGIRAHTQVATIAPLWEHLAEALLAVDRSGYDVIVDVGRLGMHGAALPLVYAADLALLATRTSLPAVSAARSWATALRDTMTAHGKANGAGLLLVGDGREYSAREVSQALGLPTVAALSWDPDAAESFFRGKSARRWDSGSLGRSLRAASAAAVQVGTDNQRRVEQYSAGQWEQRNQPAHVQHHSNAPYQAGTAPGSGDLFIDPHRVAGGWPA